MCRYYEYGRPMSEEEEKLHASSNRVWQLDDESSYDSLQLDQSLAFGIEGGLF